MKHSNLTSIIEFVRGAGTQEASFSPANGSNSLFSPQTGEVLSLLLILLMIVVITAMSVAVLRSRVLADSRIGDFLTFRSNKKLRRLAITTIVLIASIVYCVCVCSIAPKAFASSSQYASLTDKVTASVNDQHQITWSESKLTNTSGEYSVKITSCELQKKASAAADVNFVGLSNFSCGI